MESSGWRVEFWILGPNDYVVYTQTEVYANPSTDSEIYYSIEINYNTEEVLFVIDIDNGEKTALWRVNERDYGDYFDFTGTMVESYYYDMSLFSME